MFYIFRSTEDKLQHHLNEIDSTGDEVRQVIYKGGRDYLLICSKDQTEAVG